MKTVNCQLQFFRTFDSICLLNNYCYERIFKKSFFLFSYLNLGRNALIFLHNIFRKSKLIIYYSSIIAMYVKFCCHVTNTYTFYFLISLTKVIIFFLYQRETVNETIFKLIITYKGR